MNVPKKCILLSGKIEAFFKEGIILSPDVLHFIDSTFLNPSLRELEDIFEDESNLEKESLVELIFSPDESLQIELENCLLNEGFEEDDEKKIVDVLCSKQLKTHIVFPDERRNLRISVPDEAIASFVSKLNIYWKPDARIIKTLDLISERSVKKSDDHIRNKKIGHIKTSVTVGMRNKSIDHSEIKTKTLCLFLEKADIDNPSFYKCVDYLIDTMDGLGDREDMYEALSQRKYQYCESIRKWETFEARLRKNNMETMHLQGIKVPFINIEEVQKRIAFIDTITLAVYGRIAY